MKKKITALFLALALCVGLAAPAFANGDAAAPGRVNTVSLGGSFSAALTADGNPNLWGMNAHDTVGDGTLGQSPWFVNCRRTPARVMTNIRLPGGAVQTLPSNEPSAWAREDVNRAISLGLVPAQLQSNYTQAATRAEFAALAVTLYERVMGREIAQRQTFVDTDDINVEKAAGIGVVEGIGNNRFNPDGTLTREQAATMLSRLANAVGRPLPAHTSTFADSAQVSTWAFEAVGQMQASGIMGGIGNNLFSPQGSYTREQSIVTILRLYDLVTDGTETPVPPYQPPSSFDVDVFDLVNVERANHGLNPLQWDSRLANVARDHSVDMAHRNFFNHFCPSGRGPVERLADAGISWWFIAENIARGQRTPESVVAAWMNSPPHRRNILDPALTHLGVGFYEYHWTQKFIGI